jgi:iron(III) transport system substrate-binding protein
VALVVVDFLSRLTDYPELMSKAGLPPIGSNEVEGQTITRPIKLGPGLLVFLDAMRREDFLRSWTSSITQ